MTDFAEVKKAVLEQDAMRLRELASEYSLLAVTEQTPKTIKLALITYSLNKIFSKVHFQENANALAKEFAGKLDAEDLDGILKSIEEFDSKHGFFEGNLVNKAKIKIGARLYSNGLSAAQSANLVGARLADILSFIGETKTDVKTDARSVEARLNAARKLFK